MKPVFSINFFYLSNFKWKSNFKNLNEHPNFLIKSSEKITCKNFLMLYIFTKNFVKLNNTGEFVKTTLIFRKNKQNIFNVLRAPYKNKLARNQITTRLFKTAIKIDYFHLGKLTITNPNFFFLVLREVFKQTILFESNMSNLNKLRIKTTFNVSDFWNYKTLL